MKISEMIKELKKVQKFIGVDAEVSIADGYEFHFYKGEFEIEALEEPDGTWVAEIGIGGCEEK